jgi:hypothetical protein
MYIAKKVLMHTACVSLLHGCLLVASCFFAVNHVNAFDPDEARVIDTLLMVTCAVSYSRRTSFCTYCHNMRTLKITIAELEVLREAHCKID